MDASFMAKTSCSPDRAITGAPHAGTGDREQQYKNFDLYSYRVSRPIGPNSRRKLEGRRTDDFPAVPAPHLVGFGAIGRSGRPHQLFFEKAAGPSRSIKKQNAACFAAGIFPGMWHAPWQERAGARPADGDLISDLKGDFAAQ